MVTISNTVIMIYVDTKYELRYYDKYLIHIFLFKSAGGFNRVFQRTNFQDKEDIIESVTLVGRVLNERYQIMQEIGHGANGIVYLAIDRHIHQKWAIKEMNQCNHTEAELLKRVEHTAIVGAVTVFTENQKTYMVSEYIDGCTLEKLVQEKNVRINEQHLLKWEIELAEALIYLHGLNPAVIHRDIKPGNIMIDTAQNLKLIDFGIAKEQGQAEAGQKAYGSVGFAAPEQYGDRYGRAWQVVDRRSDLYAFGKTFSYVLVQCGLKPSVGMRLILGHCMKEQPRRRFQSAKRLKRALWVLRRVRFPEHAVKRRKWCVAGLLVALGVSIFCCVGNERKTKLRGEGIWNVDSAQGNKGVGTVLTDEHITERGEEGQEQIVTDDLPELDVMRFWENYETLQKEMDGTIKIYQAAKPSLLKYEGLLGLCELYAPFADESEESVRQVIGILEVGLDELEKQGQERQEGQEGQEEQERQEEQKGKKGQEEQKGRLQADCERLKGIYYQQLFAQYRLLGLKELQEHKKGALRDLTAAVEYGELAQQSEFGTAGEEAELNENLKGIYRILDEDVVVDSTDVSFMEEDAD